MEIQRRGRLLTDGTNHVVTDGIRSFRVRLDPGTWGFPDTHKIVITYDFGPEVEIGLWMHDPAPWVEALASATEIAPTG